MYVATPAFCVSFQSMSLNFVVQRSEYSVEERFSIMYSLISVF